MFYINFSETDISFSEGLYLMSSYTVKDGNVEDTINWICIRVLNGAQVECHFSWINSQHTHWMWSFALWMGWYVCTEAQMLPVCLFSLIIHHDVQERTSNFCTTSLMASPDSGQSIYWQNGQVDFLEKRKGMLRVYHP